MIGGGVSRARRLWPALLVTAFVAVGVLPGVAGAAPSDTQPGYQLTVSHGVPPSCGHHHHHHHHHRVHACSSAL
ncbi:MAG: hypothetical protein ACLP9C_14125 [Acidimicrobiales bacterium]